MIPELQGSFIYRYIIKDSHQARGVLLPTESTFNSSTFPSLSMTASTVWLIRFNLRSRLIVRHYGQQVQFLELLSREITRAIPNAAPAATLPIKAVCSALRIGRVPVKRPLMKPKTNSATSVTVTETRAQWRQLCISETGGDDVRGQRNKPPAA